MKCVWENLCGRKYLCCNFCAIKKCDLRCQDNHEKCKFFCDIPCDPTSAEETNEPPIKPQKGDIDEKCKKKRKSK